MPIRSQNGDSEGSLAQGSLGTGRSGESPGKGLDGGHEPQPRKAGERTEWFGETQRALPAHAGPFLPGTPFRPPFSHSRGSPLERQAGRPGAEAKPALYPEVPPLAALPPTVPVALCPGNLASMASNSYQCPQWRSLRHCGRTCFLR